MENYTYYRPTIAKINLQAIKNNVQNLKKHLKEDVAIIAVVKANAYGHGDVPVARAALQAGATMLAVATPEEAIRMREHFQDVAILVLGASPVHFVPYASEHRISLTVFSKQWLEQVHTNYTLQQPLSLHLKVDSGMGRIGVTTVEQVQEIEAYIAASNNFILDGVFTHFATADEETTTHFDNQINKFRTLLNSLKQKPKIVHIANTATALIKDEDCQYDAVRYGISMYGLAPSDYVKSILPFKLEEAFSLETELVHVKQLQKGDTVGYGAQFTATEPCFVGTLPIGYADGMIRKLGGQEVLVDGQRCPIVGRICMDQCMILLPKAYNVGEKVILLGTQSNEEIRIDEWAKKCETINYEVPCIITQRVTRIYSE